MKTTHKITIEWHELDDEKPADNLFFPCLIVTPEGIGISRYVGEDFTPDKGQAVVDGFLRGGWCFSSVESWTPLGDILGQFETEGLEQIDLSVGSVLRHADGTVEYIDCIVVETDVDVLTAELAEARRIIAAYEMTFENNRIAIEAAQEKTE